MEDVNTCLSFSFTMVSLHERRRLFDLGGGGGGLSRLNRTAVEGLSFCSVPPLSASDISFLRSLAGNSKRGRLDLGGGGGGLSRSNRKAVEGLSFRSISLFSMSDISFLRPITDDIKIDFGSGVGELSRLMGNSFSDISFLRSPTGIKNEYMSLSYAPLLTDEELAVVRDPVEP